MPLTFVYAAGLALVGGLALYAPHARGFCATMAELLSFFLVIAGSFEVFQRKPIE